VSRRVAHASEDTRGSFVCSFEWRSDRSTRSDCETLFRHDAIAMSVRIIDAQRANMIVCVLRIFASGFRPIVDALVGSKAEDREGRPGRTGRESVGRRWTIRPLIR
jgi:hypothetical protein